MDYRRVRQMLQAIRFERKMSVPELAEEAGIAKTTIYRLEEVDEEPDRAVDMDTIERLTAAMEITLSDFFIRIEGLQAPATERSVSAARQSETEGAHGSGFVSGGDVLARKYLDDIGAALTRNTNAIFQLVTALDRITTDLIASGRPAAREQAPSTRAARSVRGPRRRKVG